MIIVDHGNQCPFCSPLICACFFVIKFYNYTFFAIKMRKGDPLLLLITAHKVGVSQGSSGTDVPAFVNEKGVKPNLEHRFSFYHKLKK